MSEHELWNELGNLYYLAGSYDQAAHAYNKAIQLASGFGKSYSNLALIYAKQTKYEDAIRLYKKSLELLTDDMEQAITWNRLGNAYRQRKEYQEAVFAYQCADDLKSAIAQKQSQSDQLLYVSSESEPLPYEVLEEPLEYQNGAAGYTSEIEPEFENALPDLVQVEAEILVDEASFDQNVHKTLVTENLFGLAPIHPLENTNSPVQISQESEPATFPGSVLSEETLPYGETGSEEDIEELVFQDGFSLLKNIWLPIEDSVPEAAATEEEVDANPGEIDTTTADENFHSEVETMETNSVSETPIAQANQDGEELSDEIAPTISEADSRSAQDALEADPMPIELIAQVEAESEIQKVSAPESIQDIQPVDTALNKDVQEAKREIGTEVEKLTKQIEINPRSATTWEALGTLYKTAGRYNEAIQAFKHAISIAPREVSYYHNLGLVYAAQGSNEDAFNAFQKVLELDPNHSLTHASLGGYYKKIGLDELAQKHIGKAMKHIYESENEYNRACLDAICGNNDQAIELLRVALEHKQTYVDWVLSDPDLDSLRGDERFKQLVSDFSK